MGVLGRVAFCHVRMTFDVNHDEISIRQEIHYVCIACKSFHFLVTNKEIRYKKLSVIDVVKIYAATYRLVLRKRDTYK